MELSTEADDGLHTWKSMVVCSIIMMYICSPLCDVATTVEPIGWDDCLMVEKDSVVVLRKSVVNKLW